MLGIAVEVTFQAIAQWSKCDSSSSAAHSKQALELDVFNDKMQWHYWSYWEVAGGDCTEQQSLWILGGGQDPPLLASSCKAHPSLHGIPESHKPLGTVSALAPFWPLSVPFHLLAAKSTDLYYHPCLSHWASYHSSWPLALFSHHQIYGLMDSQLVSLNPP